MKRYFFVFIFATKISLLAASEQVVSIEGQLQVRIPHHPPSEFSLSIEPSPPIESFSDWPINFHSKSYDLLQKITSLWHHSQGITDYMVYGSVTAEAKEKFHWLVIGYPQQGWGPWKQGTVVWHLLQHTSSLSGEKQKELVEHYRTHWHDIPLPAETPSTAEGKDAFCVAEVIAKQRIFSGNHIDILYNYAPLAPGKAALHFLVIPKEHRTTLLELSREEFIEASIFTNNISHYFLTHGYQTAHIFHKNGVEAGQSVPHWHQHIVLTATSDEDFVFLFNLIKNALCGPTPLSEHDLAERVHEYSQLLRTILRGEPILHGEHYETTRK
jgi:diadenosine tetraphosphate (Ap4A) HIT family hydrolase